MKHQILMVLTNRARDQHGIIPIAERQARELMERALNSKTDDERWTFAETHYETGCGDEGHNVEEVDHWHRIYTYEEPVLVTTESK